MFKGLLGGAVAAAMLAAPVQAACWNAEEASAATVRQFQSMLMVAALRCQVSGHGLMADYNAFVLANKAAIVGQNEKLKAHFIHARGPVEGQRAYDAFTTSMANGYGAAASGAEACAVASALAREAGMMAGSVEGLLMIAERQGVAATLPEGACGRPAEVIAAVVVEQAPPAPAAPVVTTVAVVEQPGALAPIPAWANAGADAGSAAPVALASASLPSRP